MANINKHILSKQRLLAGRAARDYIPSTPKAEAGIKVILGYIGS